MKLLEAMTQEIRLTSTTDSTYNGKWDFIHQHEWVERATTRFGPKEVICF